MKTTSSELLDKIIFFYEHYSNEHRNCTQPYRLQSIKGFIKDYKYNCRDLIVRETLLEHIGALPVLATTIYPYLENKNIDLGRALTMLAIHDIGELVTGDEFTFTKKIDSLGEEQKQALKLLPESLHEIYLEMEQRTSDTARFAKAVDKLIPDIIDLMCTPEETVSRWKDLLDKKPQEIAPLLKEFKHPYMIWNEVFVNLHLETLDRLHKKLEPFFC